MPTDAAAADQEPDHRYAESEVLPGGLRAVRTPGPEWAHYCLLYESPPGILFCSDLVLRYGMAGDDENAPLNFVPPAYHEDPAATRRSVEQLLDLPFSVLCLAHGAPIVGDPKAALRELLESGR